MDKQRKLKKLVEVSEKGNIGILKYLYELEEKIDQAIPTIESFVERMKGDKGDSPTEQELLDLITPLIPPQAEDGQTPTDEELLDLIKPLIPQVEDGKTPTKQELISLIKPLIPQIDNDKIIAKCISDIQKGIKLPSVDDLLDEMEKRLPKLSEPIRDSLEILQGEERLDKSAVKGLDELLKETNENLNKRLNVIATNKPLSEMIDVNIQGLQTNQSLKWNGREWVPFTPGSGGGSSISVDGVEVTDPDFLSTGDIDFVATGSNVTANLNADTVGLDELSATGTPSASTYLRGDNTWATPAGSGDVSKVGTPVDNQIGVWTGNGTIEGDANLTFDTTTDTLSTGIITATGNITGANLSGSNTGDQTSIVGITGTKAQFNTALTDGTFAFSTDLHSALTVTDSAEIDLTLTGQDLTASLITSSIDVLKLDAGVQTSLGKADSALQNITTEPIGDLSNVTITTIGDNEILQYNTTGSVWENQTLAEAGISAVGHTHTASNITDFDTEVSNNTDVALNTAKVTNATHTGDATGSGALSVVALRGVGLDSTVGSPSDGKILVYRSAGSDWILEDKPAGGSNPAINDITDVTITTVADNEVLAYDSTSSTWINQTPSEAGLAAASHTHTASEITDFDTEVANNSAVSANTAKVTNATHTGDVTGATALTIANDAVTYAKMQNVVADNVILGNNAGAGGVVDELTATEVRTLLNVADGANAYVHPNHSGDVTSVADGTTTIADNAVTLAKMAHGTDGNLITYDSSGNPAYVATGTAAQVLTSNGAGAAPTFQDATGGLANIVEDTTPQLGGALDGQGNDLNNLGVTFLTEQASAEADVAGKGQIWVKTATPNQLWFTDDAGTDTQLGTFTTTLKSKLDGIEALADVTDTTNVTAAGALMDSELADITAIKTLLAPDNTTISTFGASLIDDTTAGDARTTLGLGTLATQSGTFSGTSSGTNTGDQTITLTGDVTGTGTGTFATTIAAGAVDIAMLSATGTADGTTYLRGDGTWATPAGGGTIGGSTGSTDNAILRANGTGGSTVQSSGVTISDNGAISTTIADTANEVGLTITQNDVTNNIAAVKIVSAVNQTATTGVQEQLALEGTNAGTSGPFVSYYHNSASPATGDFMGQNFYFNNASATKTYGGGFSFDVGTTTAGSESSGIYFRTLLAGTNDIRAYIGYNGAADISGAAVGSGSSAGILSSMDAQDLQLRTGNATTGTITITDGANGDITLAPNGTGAVKVGTTNVLTESFTVAVSDETTALTTGTAKATFRMPYAMTLTAVRASVGTAPTGAILIVDINEGGSTIMTTNKLSIDATEKTSTTAATAAGITDTALADDAEITIDIDQVGSTVAGAGLKVTFIGTRA